MTTMVDVIDGDFGEAVIRRVIARERREPVFEVELKEYTGPGAPDEGSLVGECSTRAMAYDLARRWVNEGCSCRIVPDGTKMTCHLHWSKTVNKGDRWADVYRAPAADPHKGGRRTYHVECWTEGDGIVAGAEFDEKEDAVMMAEHFVTIGNKDDSLRSLDDGLAEAAALPSYDYHLGVWASTMAAEGYPAIANVLSELQRLKTASEMVEDTPDCIRSMANVAGGCKMVGLAEILRAAADRMEAIERFRMMLD